MNTISIWFDGGSHNNQSKSLRQGYGSFMTYHGDKLVTMTIDRGTKSELKSNHVHLDWGNVTNNEAEWKTFIAALWYAMSVVNANAEVKITFEFHGDSMNVLGAFIDGNKTKAKHLKPLREQAEAVLQNIYDGGAQIEFVKEDGVAVKQILGH